MAYNKSALGFLVELDPASARTRLLEAYRQADGHVPEVARILKVSARSIVRWTTQLSLRKHVDSIRRQAGKRQSSTYAVTRASRPPARGASK